MKYNLGIGIDIENVERFNNINKIKNRNFLHKVYTPNELEYCFIKNNFAEKLAIYFCGKEAFHWTSMVDGWRKEGAPQCCVFPAKTNKPHLMEIHKKIYGFHQNL